MRKVKQTILFKNIPKGVMTGWETSKDKILSRSGTFPGNGQMIVSPESVTTFVLSI